MTAILQLRAPVGTLDGTRRTISGQLVPYGVDAAVSTGQTIRLEPGSVTLADPCLALRDHDPGALLGVVDQAEQGPAGLSGRLRLADTAAAAEVLALADPALGALTGLSVGLEPVTWTMAGDVMVITAAIAREVSVVPWPAFDAARIESVTAAAPTPEEPVMPELDLAPAPAAPVAAPVAAAAPPTPAPMVTAQAPLSLRRVGDMLAATSGNLPELRAALANVTTGNTGLAGLVAPQYVSELVGLITMGRPVVQAFRQGDLTSSPVQYPHWDTLPLVDVQATEKTAIASGPATISWKTAPAVTYAGGNDLSMQVIDWSSGAAITAYLQACAEVYARKTEQAFADVIVAALALTNTPTVPASGDLVDDIGAALGLVIGAGFTPSVILAGATVFGQAWSAMVKIGGNPSGAVAGLSVAPTLVPCWSLPPTTLVVTSPSAAMTWEKAGSPVEIRAVDVSLLGVDLGVYGYMASAVLHPEALVEVGPAVRARAAK